MIKNSAWFIAEYQNNFFAFFLLYIKTLINCWTIPENKN